jgi:hypothetical protein
MRQHATHGPFAFFFTSLGSPAASGALSLDEAFLQALKAADPQGKSAMRIYRGGLLLSSGSRKPQAISMQTRSDPAARSALRATQSYTNASDKTLHGVRLGDFAGTCLERCNTFDRKTLWDFLANRATDVTVVSELAPEVVQGMDEHLRAHPRYFGVVSPDLGNPLHRELLVDMLLKDVFIRGGEVYARRDFSGELHVCFDGVQEFSGREMHALDGEQFEKAAPAFDVDLPLSPRGLVTRQRMARLERLDVHQRVMKAVSYTPTGAKLPFDWDLSQLPDSPDEISVQADKLTKYLLDPSGKGASKAKFFKEELKIGPEDWKFLHAQLVDGLAALEIEDVRIEDHYGIRFAARFPLRGINGATATILTAWIIRRGERATLTTAYPLKKDAALEESVQRPLVLVGLPEGEGKWAAIHALAKDCADAAMKECVPRPMVIGGEIVMEGAIGTAYIVMADSRSGFARWTKANRIAQRHHPRGVAIEAERLGQSAESATAYAHAYAKVLGRNEIECTVETYLD